MVDKNPIVVQLGGNEKPQKQTPKIVQIMH